MNTRYFIYGSEIFKVKSVLQFFYIYIYTYMYICTMLEVFLKLKGRRQFDEGGTVSCVTYDCSARTFFLVGNFLMSRHLS